VVIPVKLDVAGTVIDGHHRLRAFAELRAAGEHPRDPPMIVRPDLADGRTLTTRYSVLARSDDELTAACELVSRLPTVAPPRTARPCYRRRGVGARTDA
jgi:hypothetical protein